MEAPSKETRKINLVTGVSKFAQTTTERGKGLNPEQMAVWKVRRNGLPWETCLPSFSGPTASFWECESDRLPGGPLNLMVT